VRTVPEGARVILELDKEAYFLGENILLHFCLENVSKEPFRFHMGADSRLASRPMRFKVTAADEKGQPVADPDPSGYHRGGAGRSPELRPGEKYYVSLPLVRYCRFERPGVYTVRATHDFGWKETAERKRPVGETTLRLLMPNEQQARQVVRDMENLSPPRRWERGKKRPPYPDFTALRYPVYLPILLERAQWASERALKGIGNMPIPEATRALIALLEHKRAGFSLKVMHTLNRRLPDPQLEGKLGRRRLAENPRTAERRWLVQTSWRPEFAPPVLAHGRKLLASSDRDRLVCGAFILECLGGKAEFPLLVQALDRAVRETQRTPRESGSYPPPRGACRELRRAAQLLIQRGAEVTAEPKSPGEAVVFMMAFWYRKGFRPQGWEATCARLVRHEIAYVRQVVLALLPRPPAKRFVDLLPTFLADPDIDVRIQACRVARDTRSPALREPVLKIVASARDWVPLHVAMQAADKLGCRFEALEVLASRLDDPKAGSACLKELIPRVLQRSVPGVSRDFDAATGRTLKPRWTKFLQEHREALKAGQRFRVGGPELTPDLFPPGYRFDQENGKPWP